MRQVKQVAEDLGITYTLPPQPVSYHPRPGGVGPRSQGPRIVGEPGGPGGVTGAFPGAGGQAGQVAPLPGIAIGGIGSNFGLSKPQDETKSK